MTKARRWSPRSGPLENKPTAFLVSLLVAIATHGCREKSDAAKGQTKPAGELRAFDVELEFGGTMLGPDGPAVSTQLHLAGRWTINPLEDSNVRGCLTAIERVDLTISSGDSSEQQAPDITRAAFLDACAVAKLNDQGQPEGIAYRPRDPGFVRSTLELLMLELPARIEAATSPEWSIDAWGASGFGPLHYRVKERRDDGLRITRSRSTLAHAHDVRFDSAAARDPAGKHAKIDSLFELSSDRSGGIIALAGRESVAIHGDGRRHFELRAKATGTPAAEPKDAEFPHSFQPIGFVGVSDAEEQGMVQQQAAGTRLEDVVSYARMVGLSGPAANHRERFWRALGRLRMEPEAGAKALHDLFSASGSRNRTRGYVLDLLANTGTIECEKAFWNLLEASIATGDRDMAAGHVRRIAFLNQPSPAAANHAKRLFDELFVEPPDHLAENLALALGSLTGELKQAAQPGGDMLGRHLVARLRSTRSAEGTSALLRSIGNTREPELLQEVLRFTEDTSAVVRFAAAVALRHASTEVARKRVLALVGDPVRAVQKGALVALADQTLSAEEIGHLVSLLQADRIEPSNYADLWGIVRRSNTDEPTKHTVARHMIADSRTLEYLKSELKKLEAPGREPGSPLEENNFVQTGTSGS